MVEITVYDFWDRRHYNILFALFHGLFTLGGPTTMSQRQSSPMEQDMCQGTESLCQKPERCICQQLCEYWLSTNSHMSQSF